MVSRSEPVSKTHRTQKIVTMTSKNVYYVLCGTDYALFDMSHILSNNLKKQTNINIKNSLSHRKPEGSATPLQLSVVRTMEQ